MKRLLLLGALAAAVLVPAATAAPAATHTLRGTVIAKDRAHQALVVARPGGRVQMLVAPAAFGRTGIGRTVVIRYTGVAGRLPVALTVSVKGRTKRALVQGTIVRLVRRQAIVNAGGSLLRVTLRAPERQRSLASAQDGPGVGDTVRVEVEIDDDGSLAAGAIVPASGPAGPEGDAEGELEVRGTVAALTPSSSGVAGSITVTVRGLPVSCAIPAGVTLAVKVGDSIELECRLIGTPAAWTVRVAKGEDDGDGEHAEPGDDDGPGAAGDDSSEIEVHGTITASFLQTSTVVTVTPLGGGPDVGCTIVPGSLSSFAAGDVVKMECVKVGGTLQLKEIEKAHDEPQGDDDEHGGDDHGDDDHGDDHGGHDG